MQERIERWLSYWVAKPISWVIFGIWLALKYTWLGCAWCVNRIRERWNNWRVKAPINGTPVVHAGLPIVVPAKRGSKRQAA